MLPFPFPSPNSDRARIAILFLYGMCAFYAIDMLSNLLLSGIFPAVPGNVAATAQRFLESVGFIRLVAYISTIIYFLQWFRRAYSNLHIVGAKLLFPEGWAAGAWFIPFLNLVRPYRIMREVWIETQLMGREPSEKRQALPLTLVNLWWALWLLASLPAQYSISTHFDEMMAGKVPAFTGMDHLAQAASNFMLVTAGLLLIRIIRKVSVWEVELHDRYQRFVYQQQATAEPAADPQ